MNPIPRKAGPCDARRKLRRRRAPDRRGVTILVVLALISIALALSYGILRSQGQALQVQQNASHRDLSRHAALTGMSLGLRKMHQSDWAGVDTTLAGVISSEESYSVQYTTGDPRLVPGGPDYDRWPYRVTLDVTGYSANPASPATPSAHSLRAVVELAPKRLAAEPADWDLVQQYTVFQCAEADFTLEFPSRVEGPVWVQGGLWISQDYPEHSGSRIRYLSHLETMHQAKVADYRVLSGPVSWQNGRQDNDSNSMVKNMLGLTTVLIGPKTTGNWRTPGQYTAYRMYPGGKLYQTGVVSATVTNVTLQPDPTANPLGIFFRFGDVTLVNDVTVQGTLIATGDVLVMGRNVRFQPIELPAIRGSSKPVRLPAVVAGYDFRVGEAAGGSAQGLISAVNAFEIKRGMEDVAFDLSGRVLTNAFAINGRLTWDYPAATWSTYLAMFDAQAESNNPVTPYFPVFMGFQGRDPKPLLTIRPPDGSVIDHWKRAEDPVYVPHPDDAGLCWTLLDLTEN